MDVEVTTATFLFGLSFLFGVACIWFRPTSSQSLYASREQKVYSYMSVSRFSILLLLFAHVISCGNFDSQNQEKNLQANIHDTNLLIKVVSVKDKLSFGFCRIDCNQELKIENAKVIYTVTGNGDLRDSVKQVESEITIQEWNDILQSIDRESFLKIPNVIGQPDGFDEGAERVEVSFNDGTTKSTIFSWRGEPQGLKDFTKKVAIIRERFSKQIKKRRKAKVSNPTDENAYNNSMDVRAKQ